MRKLQKHYKAEEKVAILRRYLLDKVPMSDLHEELGLQPTVFYDASKHWTLPPTANRCSVSDDREPKREITGERSRQ
jgi:hypothetical protein